jgi:hypothetical protein
MCWFAVRAPVGYEDETGWHEGEQPDQIGALIKGSGEQ